MHCLKRRSAARVLLPVRRPIPILALTSADAIFVAPLKLG